MMILQKLFGYFLQYVFPKLAVLSYNGYIKKREQNKRELRQGEKIIDYDAYVKENPTLNSQKIYRDFYRNKMQEAGIPFEIEKQEEYYQYIHI